MQEFREMLEKKRRNPANGAIFQPIGYRNPFEAGNTDR
jgi:hypothetical protein